MAEQHDLDEEVGWQAAARIDGIKSRDTLYKRIKAGKFPAPLPNDGKSPNKWRKSVLVAYQREKYARLEELAKRQESERAAA